MKLTKRQLRKLIKEELSEVGGLGRAMGGAMGGLPGDEDTGTASSLEDGIQALIQNWNPRTPEGRRYLEDLEDLAAQFQGGEEPRDPHALPPGSPHWTEY